MMWRRLAALVWTLLWLPVVYFALGFMMMGDCAEPADQCMRRKRLMGLAVLAIGLAVLFAMNWLILRRRDDF
jgi:DMSO/TMAO reductase YedYZ heme-binding membrane subunit